MSEALKIDLSQSRLGVASRRALTVVWIFSCAASLARADEPLSRVNLPGESAAVGRRLGAADKLVDAKQWPEAVEELQRIIEESGDDLIPLNAGLSVQARRLCHQRLAGLPAAALRLYRTKVDAQAHKWLEQADKERDDRWLRRIVDEAFCSQSGELALDRLGDGAFERGDFDEAEGWWRQIAGPAQSTSDKPVPAEMHDSPVYPDPRGDVARIRAKQILARIFDGDRVGAAHFLGDFRARHGKAEGALAGRHGIYAAILDDWLRDKSGPVGSGAWTTFAGSPARSQIVERAPRRLDRPTWTWSLDGKDLNDEVSDGKVEGPAAQARRLAFHPVVVGDEILLADARTVTGYHLLTGDRTVWYDIVADGKSGDLTLSLQLPAVQDLRYTMSVADDRVFVRMGTPVLGPRKAAPRGKTRESADSFLVCLARVPDAQGNRLRWLARADTSDPPSAIFEGAPIVHNGQVFIAVTRFSGGSVTAIACFDADSGTPLWRQPVDVVEDPTPRTNERRVRHHLLTLAGPRLIYCSHSGALAAVEARTGRRAWALRYASRGDFTADARPSPRDLAPCVYAEGRVFAAPSDYGRIICVDPQTGRRLWESDPPVEVVHLLGVARGRLIFTTPNDIRAVDVATGRTLRDWMYPDDGVVLPSFGQGLLAGDWVFWPTANGLRVLDQETGRLVSETFNYLPNSIRGNLAWGHETLVVADVTRLHAFVPPRRFLEQRRTQLRTDPGSAWLRYELAQAEADAGLTAAALKEFAHIENNSANTENWLHLPLGSLARMRRQQLLIALAEGEQSRRNTDAAAEFLRQASASNFSVVERLDANFRLAHLWGQAAQPARAVQAWQSILSDDALSTAILPSGESAGAAAQRHIDEVIAAHGKSVYASIEQEARRQFTAGNSEGRKADLKRLGRHYPNASVTQMALLELAAAEEKDRNFAAAANAYRSFLRSNNGANDRIRALAGLAEAYERESCSDAAQQAWRRLDREYGNRVWARLDPARSVHEFVVDRLKRHKQAGRIADADWKVLPRPAWEERLGDPKAAKDERLLVPDDEDCFASLGRLFFVQRCGPNVSLACRSASAGQVLWRSPIPFMVNWIGRHADIVVAAGAEGVVALSLADGVPIWIVSQKDLITDDFANESSGGLGRCHLASGRLIFLQANRRLWAVEVETGCVAWNRWAPAGRLQPSTPAGLFHPHFYADSHHVTVQTSSGHCWVLDSRSGRLLSRIPTEADGWPRPPVADGHGRLVIATDSQLVICLEPATGKVVWRQTVRKPTLTGRAPHLSSDGKALLVLVDGWELERWDFGSGQVLWSESDPRWAARIQSDHWFTAIDSDTVYFERANLVTAYRLQNGKRLWELPLDGPAGPWRTRQIGSTIVVHPNIRWAPTPRPWLLGGFLLAPPRMAAPQSFPVVLCDRRDGRLLHRFQFWSQASGSAVQCLEAGLAISAMNKASFFRTDRGN